MPYVKFDTASHYSILKAAEALGVNYHTFWDWVYSGKVAKPTTQIGSRRFYSQTELSAVAQTVKHIQTTISKETK